MIPPRLHNIGICAAIIIAGGCARAVVRPPAPEPAADVQLDARDVRSLAELLRMEDVHTLDAPLVSHHLGDSVPEVRARAALAAARTGDRAAVPLLLRALQDPHSRVRARAAFALGELGDSSVSVISALSSTALRDDAHAAVEAAAALGRIGASGARPALDSILVRTSPDTALLHETLLVAWRLPRDPSTLGSIARWTADADPETRWRAVYALARNGGAYAIEPLLRAVTDPDARVRAWALRGLRAGPADSAGRRERALTAILEATRDEHAHVRINAINLLPGYRANPRTTPALVQALGDTVANVAVAAANALAQAADPTSSGALAAATAATHPDGLRTAALHAWMHSDSAAATRLALQWADSARWLLRMHAARALIQAPLAAAAPALHELARDTSYLVAAEALGAISTVADSLPASRRLYLEQMAAAHPLVRAAAIRGMAPHVGAADLELLLQAWDRARRDSIPDAAAAALNALARVRRSGIPVERSFFLRFGTYGPPARDRLHRLIIDSIGTPPPAWGEPREDIEPRPIGFYEDIVRRYVVPVLAGAAPPQVVITTPHGDIVLDLAAAEAPLTVHNFISLIERGYYTGTRWHRVVPNFVIQDGDPRGDGSGGPGYSIRDEINPLRYLRGTLGMALSGPDTGGSQYFITHSPQPHLDGGYTVFGRVSTGMNVVDSIVQEDPILAVRVVP